MSERKEAGQLQSALLVSASNLKAPATKRKEEAKQILYIDRI